MINAPVAIVKEIARLESTTITRHDGSAWDVYIQIGKGPEQMARDLQAARALRKAYGLG